MTRTASPEPAPARPPAPASDPSSSPIPPGARAGTAPRDWLDLAERLVFRLTCDTKVAARAAGLITLVFVGIAVVLHSLTMPAGWGLAAVVAIGGGSAGLKLARARNATAGNAVESSTATGDSGPEDDHPPGPTS